MDGSELKRIRNQDHLDLTQAQMAAALGQSVATVNRWENNVHRLPEEVVRLLECLRELVDRARAGKLDSSLEELREAVKAAGVVGVVSEAARAGYIPRLIISRLATLPAFAWFGVMIGCTAAVSLPFFIAARKRRKEERRDSSSEHANED